MLGFICLLAILSGCSKGSSRVEMPGYDPGSASAKAMEAYDTDKDGFVAGDELENAPGLKAALRKLDKDGDGKVSEEEIAERVRSWQGQGVGLLLFNCDVLLDGRAVEGATVTLVPDSFLEGTIQESSGTTNSLGTASPRVPKEKRASPTDPPGTQLGIYKVQISKVVGGKEIIPPQYNSETIFGQEVAKDDLAISNKRVLYDMKSK